MLKGDGKMIILAMLVGLVLTLICGCGLWWLIGTIWMGIVTSNWVMVVGGGVLAYLLIGLFIIEFFTGLYLFAWGLFE